MRRWMWTLSVLVVAAVATAIAQQPGGRSPGGGQGGGPGGGPGRGPDGPGGPGGGRPPMPIVEALDADHDGVISANEIKNASAALRKLDRNKDGKLTEDEYRPMGRGLGGPGDGDRGGPGGGERRGPEGGGPGAGDRGPGAGPGGPGAEFAPNPDRMLEHAMEFDADKDGKLSKDELQKFVDDFVKHHAGPGGPGGGGRGGAAGPPGGGSPNEGGDRSERPRRPE